MSTTVERRITSIFETIPSASVIHKQYIEGKVRRRAESLLRNRSVMRLLKQLPGRGNDAAIKLVRTHIDESEIWK